METLRLVRKDALPEDSHYYDDGCEVSPSCLTCYLVKCRYDYPQGLKTVRHQAQVDRTAYLRGLGYACDVIADLMQSSVRSVHRRLATARHQSADTRLSEVSANSGIVVLIGESSYGTA